MVLILDLGAHVDGHVPQVADHAAHLAEILVHLVLARIVRDAIDEALRGHALITDDSSRSVRVQLAVLARLPRLVVVLALLELVRLVPRQHAQPAALLQALQILLRLFHLLIDSVRALFDSIQLLTLLVQHHERFDTGLFALFI